MLFSEPLLIVVPPKHRFARSKKLALKALADEPLILMKPGHGYRKIVVDAMTRAGIQPRVVHETGEIDTVQALVRPSMGVSLVPEDDNAFWPGLHLNTSAYSIAYGAYRIAR
ncbi:MAG: hypothetical protein B7X47_05185 [Ferrovum sp. 34-44-207]|nr:MAG: hypothetical protein B7Z65_09425 [Ferrovum sp. 21-44-67]OZB33060.1 MAG: hypothetical protein B7X47_05185 [Ferrovum sp. 34-44-207]